MKISVAAVPYFWSAENYRKFYKALAETSVDIVYLGETICSKRRSLKLKDWLEIAAMLSEAGKEVVLSTLILIEAESELSILTKISKQHDYLIEANDMAAVQVASENNNKFVAGSAINIYNNSSLKLFNEIGMSRWCIPVELGKEDLLPMIFKAKNQDVELEYQVFGRLPLAYSARCFTARHHRLAKDNCQFKCLDDEQGILVKTQEDQSFSQINGIQIQSAKVNNLYNHLDEIEDLGIDILRLVPIGQEDTLEAVRQFSKRIGDKLKTPFDEQLLQEKYEFCNGYYLQLEGMVNSQQPITQ